MGVIKAHTILPKRDMGCANPPQNAEGTEKPFFPAGNQSSTKPSLRQTEAQSPTQSFMSCNSTVLQNLLEKSYSKLPAVEQSSQD